VSENDLDEQNLLLATIQNFRLPEIGEFQKTSKSILNLLKKILKN
jgi:hypothetical protein